MGTQLGMLEKKYDVEVVSNAIDTRFHIQKKVTRSLNRATK